MIKPVISNGLICYLDSNNPNSYSGTGSTWYDLSGNNNNATLSGHTWSDGNMHFDGSTTSLGKVNLNLTGSSYTIIGVARRLSATKRVISSNGNNWLLGWWSGNTQEYYAEGWVTPVYNRDHANSWYFVCGTGDISGDKYSMYWGGYDTDKSIPQSELITVVSNSNGGSAGPSGITLGGSGVYTSENTLSDVRLLYVYNRDLLDSEVNQIYRSEVSVKTNIFPFPNDIYSFVTTGADCTLSRDTILSPVGSTPLKMVSSGTDPFTSYNTKELTLSSAKKGETFTFSCYVKGSVAGVCKLYIFGCNSNCVLINPYGIAFWCTTDFVLYSTSITFVTDVSYMQVRFDGIGNNSGTTTWFDGITVTRTTPIKYTSGKQSGTGRMPYNDSSDINTTTFEQLQVLMNKSVNGGTTFTNPVVSTYSLIYTTTDAYVGGVLSSSGDIHFSPYAAAVGQKISLNGAVSTYSLLYTASGTYVGGVLSSSSDIHFVPWNANRGQKISASGVVSTYSLIYTTTGGAYFGGVLAPNGDIHFVPYNAPVGQKISSGVASTYSLIYTASGAYAGGCLSPNGDIHFVPQSASVGQKIDINGTVSTYSLVYTGATAYAGGALSPNGDIHFSPYAAAVGQKISVYGVVSTYALVSLYVKRGGVLSPNGDIHFVPFSQTMAQKVSSTGVVSTYSLVYSTTFAYESGILLPNGDIHLIPRRAAVGQKISTMPAVPFSLNICKSSFLNKF